MSNIWNYGQYELDKDALLGYLLSNADSYMAYHDYSDEEKQLFSDTLSDISNLIREGQITGDGYNNFTDSTGSLNSNDMTNRAFNYIHTIANAQGKKFGNKKTKTEEKEPEKEAFDYIKHGVFSNLVKKVNPVASSQSDYMQAILDYYKSFNGDNVALLSDISSLFDNHVNNLGNYKFDDADSHIANVRLLQEGLKDGTIDDADIRNFSLVGLRDLGILLQDLLKAKSLEVHSYQGEGANRPDPFGHIQWDGHAKLERIEEEGSVTPMEGFKVVDNGDGTTSYVPELEQVDWAGFRDDEVLRLLALGLDLAALLDPEPITATGMGFYSDYLNYKADQIDPNVTEKGLNWGHGLNASLSLAGAIPVFGDIFGSGSKIGKQLIKVGPIIGKWLGGLGMAGSAVAGVANHEALSKSLEKVMKGEVDNLGVEDYRNMYQVLSLMLGSANTFNRAKSQQKINDILDKNKIKDAVTMDVTIDGKKKRIAFEGEEAALIKSYENDPILVLKYLRANYKGLENVEVPVKYTKLADRVKHKTLLGTIEDSAPKKVVTETKDIVDKAGTKEEIEEIIPVFKSRWMGTYANRNNPELLSPSKKKPTQTTEKPKTEEAAASGEEGKINIPPGKSDERAEVAKASEGPATEVKPDIESKAGELANINSKVVKHTVSGIKKRLKSFYRGKFDELDEIDAATKTMERRIKEAGLHGRDKANLVAKKGGGSREYEVLLRRLIESGEEEKTAKEILRRAGAYKEGGILKALDGAILTPDWFKNLYKQSSLNNWDRSSSSANWKLNEHTFHGNADSLDTVYQANNAYTLDTSAVTKDLQNYFDSNAFESVDDFINQYNSNANTIRSYWDSEHSYKDDASTINPLYRQMFASRSVNENGNPAYTLGYQDDLEKQLGSTTWHRRMDRYEKEWDALTDAEKMNRIHSIELGGENNVWVYKLANGDIAKLSDEEFDRLFNGTQEEQQNDGKVEGKAYQGLREEEDEVLEVQKPERPTENFFTPDKALAALNYFRARGHNARALEDAKRMVPLLYDHIEHHRPIYGNLRAIELGHRAAGQIRNLASKPLTSDGSLATAQRMEGENLALQYILLGWLSDDATMREMSERALLTEKENREGHYNIAMKNRENQHLVNMEKIMALINKNRADYESGTNLINEYKVYLDAKHKAEQEKREFIYNRRLANYVNSHPNEYVYNWGEYHQDIWDRANAGETLTLLEQNVLTLIRNALSEGYLNEQQGVTDFYGIGVKKPLWQADLTARKKKGGKINKEVVKAVISYLKESNKNYNKDIDRSIKGLYNHIKLLRRK